jgi:hypothetical protein
MVNYEEAVTKPFTDIRNLIIGLVLSLIPIVNFTVVTGYLLECSGLGKNKPSKKMPKWDDWTELFVKGLKALAIGMAYMLPAVLVVSLGIGLAFAEVASTLIGSVLTPQMMEQLKAGGVTSDAAVQLLAQNWYLAIPGLLKLAPVFLAGALLALLASYLSPMAVLNSLAKRKFFAAFDFSTVLGKTLNVKYLTSWIIVTVLGLIFGGVLSAVPVVGSVAAMFIVGVAGYSIYGQLFREIKTR